MECASLRHRLRPVRRGNARRIDLGWTCEGPRCLGRVGGLRSVHDRGGGHRGDRVESPDRFRPHPQGRAVDANGRYRCGQGNRGAVLRSARHRARVERDAQRSGAGVVGLPDRVRPPRRLPIAMDDDVDERRRHPSSVRGRRTHLRRLGRSRRAERRRTNRGRASHACTWYRPDPRHTAQRSEYTSGDAFARSAESGLCDGLSRPLRRRRRIGRGRGARAPRDLACRAGRDIGFARRRGTRIQGRNELQACGDVQLSGRRRELHIPQPPRSFPSRGAGSGRPASRTATNPAVM